VEWSRGFNTDCKFVIGVSEVTEQDSKLFNNVRRDGFMGPLSSIFANKGFAAIGPTCLHSFIYIVPVSLKF